MVSAGNPVAIGGLSCCSSEQQGDLGGGRAALAEGARTEVGWSSALTAGGWRWSSLEKLPEPLRRGRTPLPLARLVEEEQATVPNHLLQSKIYAQEHGNGLLQVEPSALHFSGFDLGKEYQKVLKLINVSSEVMNVHILPTQTKYFQTTYIKKHRLVPGLAYNIKVHFCPDEWRYFYDCVRVHCKGDENLLIPVHAYPVIDDLRVPSYINLPAVPVGRSVSRSIPLSCSCPVDFEFQVHVIHPHEAFTVHPLAGLIPANGKVEITVSFRPLRYGTSQITVQLVVFQFNTKPHLCTISGSSAPYLAHSDAVAEGCSGPSPAPLVHPLPKIKLRSTQRDGKSKTLRDQADGANPPLKLPLDVSTPAGVAKMLIRHPDKLSSRDLREALSRDNMAALQHRQLKEALFLKKLHQDKRENAVHSRWLVRLGKDPVSEQTKRQMLEQREMDLNEYTAKRADGRKEGVFAAGSPMLSCRRVLREAAQPPGGAPAFRMHPSGHLALRCRVLRVFQQAARRVVIACRMKQRLVHLRKLTQEPKNEKAEDGQKTCDAKISPGKVLSFSFPVLPEEGNRWVPGDFAVVPTCPFGATENTHTPFLKLQVPQHYQLMGYRPVSAWEAYNTYVPPTLARPLHTGPLDEWSPLGIRSLSSGCAEAQAEDPEATTSPVLTFTAPEALLRPAPANPVRVFNPAPDLQTYKPTPKYLESDANYHLCPLPRYPVPKSSPSDITTPDTQESSLDLKEVMKGFMEIPNLSSFKHQSNLSSLTDDLTPRRCARYNTDILPERAPPPLSRLPDDMRALSGQLPGPQGAQLTPEMIRAVFLDDEVLLSKLNRGLSSGGCGVEELYWLQLNQAGERVAGRLKQLEEESRGTSVSSVGK